MPERPSFARDYRPEHITLVRQTCLYLATKLGDLMNDIVVVGGFVPPLLIDQENLPAGAEPHVGTMDLDIGLSVGLLDHERYQAVHERLLRAGFQPDTNASGRVTRQRWKLEGNQRITVDFLIPPTLPEDAGGTLRNLESDFAAIVTPGLHLAFQDRQTVTLSGSTVRGEHATRDIWVCGPGAFVVLKALAFRRRGENKDAYDLYYVIRNYGSGPEAVARLLQPILDEPIAVEAREILAADFERPDDIGPRRVAEFVTGGVAEDLQADVVAFVRALLDACEAV